MQQVALFNKCVASLKYASSFSKKDKANFERWSALHLSIHVPIHLPIHPSIHPSIHPKKLAILRWVVFLFWCLFLLRTLVLTVSGDCVLHAQVVTSSVGRCSTPNDANRSQALQACKTGIFGRGACWNNARARVCVIFLSPPLMDATPMLCTQRLKMPKADAEHMLMQMILNKKLNGRIDSVTESFTFTSATYVCNYYPNTASLRAHPVCRAVLCRALEPQTTVCVTAPQPIRRTVCLTTSTPGAAPLRRCRRSVEWCIGLADRIGLFTRQFLVIVFVMGLLLSPTFSLLSPTTVSPRTMPSRILRTDWIRLQMRSVLLRARSALRWAWE